ncbi:MAG TPA: response regulator [Anaerolineae bacterium]|nr:response regulator [Anaerolineae bacterium]
MPKVFIIDDDQTMVYLLRTLLEMDGFEVAEVRDWDAILETVEVENPDLVLMDYFLPDLDGLELLTQLRADPNLAQVRIVMSSGMDVSDQCIAAGADAFLLKPYTPEQLVEVIKENVGEDGAGS